MFERNINETLLCYDLVTSTTNGFIWQTDQTSPFKSLPVFVSQIFVILFITRLLFTVFKPLHQPFLIAEIVAGCIVGPSALGSFKFFQRIFPTRGIMLIETMADLSLLFYVFLTGLEMDASAFLRVGKKIMGIAVTGILIPMGIGIGLFFLLQKHAHNPAITEGCMFWAVALSITGFPVLTRILADLKLLHSDIGRIAMSVAMLNDMYAWVFIAVLVPVGVNLKTATFSIIAVIFFTLICFYVVRPTIERIIRHQYCSDKEHYNEYYPCFMLIGAMICGCITDAIGAHSIVGAFVFGLIIPKGDMVEELLDRLDCFVPGIMLPIFFASCGMRIDFTKIADSSSWFLVLLVICFACMAKILSSLIACFFFDMRLRDGVALGLLMNTKGILSLIILNVGWDEKILNDQYYVVMVVAILVMTSVVSPIMSAVYRPKSKGYIYGLRTVQRSKLDTELRVLSCVHTTRNVSGIISLLEVSHPTRLSPMTVFALHLVELTGRSSAMLIVHSTRRSAAHNPSRAQADSNLIINAFEAFENDNHLVTVQPLTAMSPYGTMHEDICSLAEDKRVALILLPFHKHLTVDGRMEDENADYRAINLNVLANAPCSVGLFVDRGLAGAVRACGPNDIVMCHFAMLFIGGPDDREALAYACRMVGDPRISLTVVRFLPGKEVVEMESAKNIIEVEEMLSDKQNNKRQNEIDENYINEFRLNTVDNESVRYIEKMVDNGEETVSAISAMDNSYDLYIVGKGTGTTSPLTLGLSEWSENPELGAIGDVLVSSSFALNSSVLVVQKYGSGDHKNEGRSPSMDTRISPFAS
ncbi:hypothetical protein I3843_09G121700 [Carya illinoinensis]|uniref:Cation/H+ exchanger domain-containing protein n=1 Tax=Carya illinoinensis TaxID=32201 RepID=A0A922J776_CARIL|nr:hypothetical protein I3842_09G124000 [Carya illinoinensis]KAG7963504.1 hypothetical protein I3843_09G121700 [Carya illinoinensis]